MGQSSTRPPRFPEPLRYVWNWFLEISSGLNGNGFSYPVVSWSEFECWARLTQQEPSARDVRAIVRLGVMRANILSEKLKTDGGQG